MLRAGALQIKKISLFSRERLGASSRDLDLQRLSRDQAKLYNCISFRYFW